ncbi:hypothetical protein PF004_g25689 [Phytophthora fragariae]|uniref:Uncharacterized protein n=1 Tax=Phytophthora fragariae TaxID=53985 RepID=A0A6G0MSE4_9STRA|nr:hypothetical protein PF004_g25689 [Phytophthora fragariae]
MARYARQAIEEYTMALHRDEMENAGGFRAEKRRIGGMYESAGLLIRKTLGVCRRSSPQRWPFSRFASVHRSPSVICWS